MEKYLKVYNIKDFGAVGNGIHDDAKAIQSAIDECYKLGGGRIIVPSPNVYLTGPFKLKSNIDLHVEAGASILANPDKSVYTESAFKENKSEGTFWISAENSNNISISGTGIIDGNSLVFMTGEEKSAYILPKPDVNGVDIRPHLLTIINSKNLTIRDITLKNSTYWCLHLVGCNDVIINGIRILNNLKVRNSDGIDPDHCKNVRISDCYIESGDDCICLKNRREYEEFGDCENITVTGCTLVSSSCAIKIGSENVNTIRNVVMDSCIIKSSNRGIGIQNRDEGNVENIIFSNMIIEGRLFDDVWWGKAEPIYVTCFNRDNAKRRLPSTGVQKNVGNVRNIVFNNIICESENGVFISGCEHNKPSDIKLTGVKIKINKTTKYKGGVYDRRPCNLEGLIEHPTSGFYLSNAGNVSIELSEVVWGENIVDYYGSALFAENVDKLNLISFSGKSANPVLFPDQNLINVNEKNNLT